MKSATAIRAACWLFGSIAWVVLFVVALRDVLPGSMGGDYLQFWSAGTLLLQRQNPHDIQLLAPIEREAVGETPYPAPYLYPPWLALLSTPLMWFGYRNAQVAWVALNVEAAFAAGYFLRNAALTVPRWIPPILFPLFAFSVFSALMGQTGTLVLLVAAATWRLLEDERDVAAGVVMAWLSIKPQVAGILLVALLVWVVRCRRYRVLAGFGGCLAVLMGISTLFYPQWLPAMLQAQRQFASPTDTWPGLGGTWPLVLRALGVEGWLLWVLYAAGAILFLGLVGWTAIDRHRPLAELVGISLLAGFFVAPYSQAYDYAVLLIPLLVLTGGRVPAEQSRLLWFVVFLGPYLHFLIVVLQYGPESKFTLFAWPFLFSIVWLATWRKNSPGSPPTSDASLTSR
jgi:hypothetical protein